MIIDFIDDPKIAHKQIDGKQTNGAVIATNAVATKKFSLLGKKAVAAVKAGAIDYIPKPADADDVENALLASDEARAVPPENPMSADRVKWEHINRVFELCNRNVSETARRLKMHRRTLQRILSKRSPK